MPAKALAATAPPVRVAAGLPSRAGVGLKPQHVGDLLAAPGVVGFVEIHAENYMVDGGPRHRQLEAIRRDYPLSLHGVGLSIGAPGPLDRDHLLRLKALADRYQPGLFSEHLAWSTHEGAFLNDLLPLPYTAETLALVCEHIDEVQAVLGRRMLLENPSTYVRFAESEMDEIAFLSAIVARTGCGLLLDVNNVEVSAVNHGYDPVGYLDAFPAGAVGEIHLGGHHEAVDDAGDRLLIDSHGTPVADPVWALLTHALRRTGPVPTLVEWDNDVPAWPVLAAEAARADRALAAEACRHAPEAA